MSDRFKFRAWRKSGNIMEYITDLYWFEENMVHEDGDSGYKLMQSSGEKDKNGKLAFDGDIFQWTVDGKQRTEELIFRQYEDNEGYIDDKHLGWGFSSGTLPDVIKIGGVVIGNIHQNPEKLEEMEEE